MTHVKAKFKCNEVTNFVAGISVKNEKGTYDYKEGIGQKVKFNVVSADKPENEVFAMYTPTGELTATILNPALLDSFKPGKEYYFDISPAEE